MESQISNNNKIPPTIAERLFSLRIHCKLSLSELAKRFDTNKSMTFRWERDHYWEDIDNSSQKRELLLQLAEVYETDYLWLSTGKSSRLCSAMIIDDQSTSRMIAGLNLGYIFGDGLKLHNFSSAADASSWIEGGNMADIILCDYMLPGEDSLAFVKAVRVKPTYGTTPIVIFTSHMEPSAAADYYQAGVRAIINKPIKINELRDACDANIANAIMA